MKKKVITLVIIAIVSEIIALLGVFLILTHLKNEDSMVTAAGFNTNSANIMPASVSIYGHNFSKYSDNAKDNANNTFDNLEAEIVIDKNKALIKETLHLKLSDKEKTGSKDSNTVFLYIPSRNTSTTNIKRVVQGNQELNFEMNGLMLKVYLPGNGETEKIGEGDESPFSKHNRVSISIEYEILLDKSSGTISRTNSHIYLTNFLATPAILRDGKLITTFRSSFGDPYIYNITNYSVSFIVDKDVDIYAPGNKTIEQQDNEKKNINFEAELIRDFPAIILKNNESSGYNPVVQIEKVKGTEIYFINSNKTRDFVKEAFLFAYENIGPYPYDKFFVIESVDMSLRGMEFSNMIFISKSCNYNKDILRRVTYHEVFHQWFYGIIGTDQLTEPFLDEGLVNYLSMYLAGDKFGNTYDNSFLEKDLRDYASVNEYYNLAYDEATVYFADIHKQLGNNFYEMLKKIYNDKKYSILYYNEFNDYLSTFLQGGK